MRTRVTEYKVTVASNMAVVHVKKPSGITLAAGTASPEVYRITVEDENWDSDKTFLYDTHEGAWYEEGVTPVVYYDGTAPDVIISNGTTGASIVDPNNNLAYGTITAIEHIEAVAGDYTDAAKRTITEALRLIYDETQKVLLCSTAKKANIYSIEPSSETGYDIAISFNLTALAAEATAAGKTDKATAISNIAATDQFTIAVDWGTSAEDIKGSNPDATLTAVLEALTGGDEPSPDIPEGVAERLAMILEHFGIKTISGYEFMQDTEVTDELEDIMQALDPELGETVEYPEGSGTYMTKAQAITAEAMNIINPSQS